MNLLLLWLPSAFLLEHEWEHGDHRDHSLMTQSVAQGISQATTSGRGSSEQRWCGTSSPGANKTRQTWRKAQLGSISTVCIKQTNFMSNVRLPMEEHTTKSTWLGFRLESVIHEQLKYFFRKAKKKKKCVSSFVCDILAAIHFIKQASTRNEIIQSIESCSINYQQNWW